MANGNGIKWTKAMDDCLQELWGKGFAAQGIAERLAGEFGHDFTHQGVTARASQLGLEPDDSDLVVFQQPRQYEHIELAGLDDGERVVVVSDMQMPFHDKRTLKAIEAFIHDFEPTVFVMNGDGFDFYAMSDFDKNPSRVIRLHEELTSGRRVVTRWRNLMHKADLYWVDGNHEDRLRRWLWRHGPAVSNLPALAPTELMGLSEGWNYLSYGSSVKIGGYVIEHGEGSAQNLAHRMFGRRGTSGMVGHSHRLHDYYATNAAGAHRYLEIGCTCRLDAMEYVARPNWQQGFAYGFIHKKVLLPTLVHVTEDGFRSEGHWYKR